PGPNPPPSYFGGQSSMSGLGSNFGFNGDDTHVACTMDGMPTSCSRLFMAIRSGLGDKLTLSGASRADLLTLGIVLTEGPLQNDTRLWGIWAVIPGSQPPQDPGQRGIFANLEKCMNKYLAEDYPEGKPKPDDLNIGLAM